jgi:hypothetical protein
VFLTSLADHESRCIGSAEVSIGFLPLSGSPATESESAGRPSEARNTSRSPPRSEPAIRSVPPSSRGRSGRWRRTPSSCEPERRSRSCYWEFAAVPSPHPRMPASREHRNTSRNNKQSSHLSVSCRSFSNPPQKLTIGDVGPRVAVSITPSATRLPSTAAPNHHSLPETGDYRTVWRTEQPSVLREKGSLRFESRNGEGYLSWKLMAGSCQLATTLLIPDL